MIKKCCFSVSVVHKKTLKYIMLLTNKEYECTKLLPNFIIELNDI